VRIRPSTDVRYESLVISLAELWVSCFPTDQKKGKENMANRTTRQTRAAAARALDMLGLCGLHLVIGTPEFMFIVKPVLQRIIVQGLESINLRPMKLLQKIRS